MKIMMITGAGISTGAGLPTYRGQNGLYTSIAEDHLGIEELLSISTLKESPELIWNYWVENKPLFDDVTPSRAHRAIVKISEVANQFLEVTQNVDGLSLSAGIDPGKIIELHGSCNRFICTKCKIQHSIDIKPGMTIPPLCFTCSPEAGAVIRPDVVLFGELVSSLHYKRAMEFCADLDLLIICGTTLQFMYLISIIEQAIEQGARVICIDPEPSTKNLLRLSSPQLDVMSKIQLVKACADEGLEAVISDILSTIPVQHENL